MAKITGVGGVFFKSTGDREALAAWYRDHLGLPLVDFGGAILKWSGETAEDQRLTVWHVASKDSEWFSPSLVALHDQLPGRRSRSTVGAVTRGRRDRSPGPGASRERHVCL